MKRDTCSTAAMVPCILRSKRNFFIGVILCLSWSVLSSEAFNKFNVPLEKLGTCSELFISKRLGNTQNLALESFQHDKPGKDEELHLKIFVTAAKDVHIFLMETDDPLRLTKKEYQFQLGALENQKSILRIEHLMDEFDIVNEEDHPFLSEFEVTPIEIIQKKDGIISLYITGYKKGPLLTYKDPDPLQITFISFSTFGGLTSRWLYDCDLGTPIASAFSNENTTQPACPDPSLLEFDVDVYGHIKKQSLMTGKFKISEKLDGTVVTLAQSCARNLKQTPLESFKCKISNVAIH